MLRRDVAGRPTGGVTEIRPSTAWLFVQPSLSDIPRGNLAALDRQTEAGGWSTRIAAELAAVCTIAIVAAAASISALTYLSLRREGGPCNDAYELATGWLHRSSRDDHRLRQRPGMTPDEPSGMGKFRTWLLLIVR